MLDEDLPTRTPKKQKNKTTAGREIFSESEPEQDEEDMDEPDIDEEIDDPEDSVKSNASDEDLDFSDGKGDFERYDPLSWPDPEMQPLFVLFNPPDSLEKQFHQKIDPIFREKGEFEEFSKFWRRCKRVLRYPKMLVMVLIKMLSYKEGQRLSEIIPEKFIEGENYSFERLVVKILCSKFHAKIPNILKADLKEYACLRRYVEKLFVLWEFLDKHRNELCPMLFRGRRSFTMKDRPVPANPAEHLSVDKLVEEEISAVINLDFRLFLEEYELTYEFFGKRCDEMRKFILGNSIYNLEEKVWQEDLPPGCQRI